MEKLKAEIERNDNGEVVKVGLNHAQITNAGLVHLKGLTRLQTLLLGDTKITDAGVAEVQDQRHLTRPLLPPVPVRLLATRRHASLSIGGVWIRELKELRMKRLLRL